MLHHNTSTLVPSAAAAALRPPPPPLHHHHHHQEMRMDVVEAAALKRGRRVEAASAADAQLEQDYAFLITDGGEDFFVDDLLVFDDPDKDSMDDVPKADSFVEGTATNTTSAAVSAVKFEPPPLSLPTHDAAEFEWMSSIIDDTVTDPPPSPGIPPLPFGTTTKTHHLPPPPAAAAQPEAAGYALSAAEAAVPIKAKRTKRPRAAPSGSSWALSDTSSGSVSSPSSSSCSSPSYTSYHYAAVLYDGSPPPRPPKKQQQRPKKRGSGRKVKPPPPSSAAVATDRRCTHCGSQKTPQWRTGPLGPKTLCNACGVRYKSGRLVPEYRPAASPTFVSHVHSNSHRKVLEMRRKKEQQHHHLAAVAPAVASF